MDSDQEPDWVVQPDTLKDPLDISWGDESNEWIAHTFESLRESQSARGWRSGPVDANRLVPLQHVAFRVDVPSLTSWLVLVPTQAGLVVAIAGVGQPQADQIAPWREAVDRATARTGHAHVLHEWTAAVGLKPMAIGGIAPALDADATIGPFRLFKGTTRHTDRTPIQPPRLSGWNVNWSWPIAVEGVARGYDWNTAAAIASRDLFKLCAVLSVAWDACITLREAPQPGRRGAGIVYDVPSEADSFPVPPLRSPVLVPEWAEKAWCLVNDDAVVLQALSSYYEGMHLVEEHPSIALVCFVASIETMGGRLESLEWCDRCEHYHGAGKRFRKALRLVRQGKLYEELVNAYEPRSKTAHAGVLFGGEELFGAMGGQFQLAMAPTTQFTWFTVRRLREAAADVLRLALRDQMPAATSGLA